MINVLLHGEEKKVTKIIINMELLISLMKWKDEDENRNRICEACDAKQS